MSTRTTEAANLVDLAIRADKRIKAENQSDCYAPSSLLILAYHEALSMEAARDAERMTPAQRVRADWCRSVCDYVGVGPDCLVTEMSAVVVGAARKMFGADYWCPVLDYQPKPLWLQMFLRLPPLPEEFNENR